MGCRTTTEWVCDWCGATQDVTADIGVMLSVGRGQTPEPPTGWGRIKADAADDAVLCSTCSAALADLRAKQKQERDDLATQRKSARPARAVKP